MGFLNTLVTNAAWVAAAAYVVFMVRNFRSMMDPLSTLPDEFRHAEPQVLPLWPDEAALQIRAYVSASKAERFTDDASYAVAMPWPAGGEGGGGAMRLSLGQAAQKVELSLRDADAAARPAARAAEAASEGLLGRFLPFGPPAAPPTPPAELVVPARGWQQLRRNGTLYLHVEVSTEALDLSGLPRDRDYDAARVLRAVVPLVKHGPAPYVRCCKRKLLGDLGWVPETTGIVRPPAEGEEVALWKPEVGVRVVVETRSFPAQMQLEGLNVVQPARNTFRYLPPLYADEIGLTSDKYSALNATVDELPLTISFEPMNFARWQLISKLEQSLSSQKELGFTDTDIDDVRRLIADTQVWLLGATVFASVAHLLFEFLAFKADMNFWRKNKSLRGLSVRSLGIDLVCQIVIFFYLIDEKASMLVSVPGAFSILVQAWKVKKATGLAVVRDAKTGRFRVACLRLEADAAEAKAEAEAKAKGGKGKKAAAAAAPADDLDTQALDRVAVNSLSLVFLPLVVGGAVRSLVCDEHFGWYSWALGSATGCVYAGGFVMMTPQLYLNYRLKSVSHLPWRLLVYRFINTFIDDLFAFIIKMPTMHRVSCFRDDIVFFVYLYQRYKYPVDTTRGVADEDL